MFKKYIFVAISFLTLSLNAYTGTKGFLDYCNAEFPGQISKAEAITVGYLKLALKYKGPMPFRVSTKRIYGENGEILREMDGISSFFWYSHPSDFNNKFSSSEEIETYLLGIFADKSKCEYINHKLQTRVENFELSMPPIIGRNGEEIPFKLTTLAPLNGASILKRLILIGHNISGRDMPVLDLPSLEELQLTHSELEDISFIRNLKGLKILSLGRNNITNISALESLDNLEDVELYDNKIQDLSGLANSKEIFFLSLGGNYLEDISPLSGLRKLNYLSIQSNHRITGEYGVVDISPLSNMISMRELNIRDNKIYDLGPLSGLKNLVRLNVSKNQINNCSVLNELKENNSRLVVTNVKNHCK